MEVIRTRYLQTTYDGITGKFGTATTLVGPFKDNDTFNEALAKLNEKRRELLPGWKDR